MPKILGTDAPLDERIKQLDECFIDFVTESEAWADEVDEGFEDRALALTQLSTAAATLALACATQAAALRARLALAWQMQVDQPDDYYPPADPDRVMAAEDERGPINRA